MYSDCSRLHSYRFTFGGVTLERVNTNKTGRKVFPVFGWSLASSRVDLINFITDVTSWQHRKWDDLFDFDSTRVQVNALGHIPTSTPLLSIEGCYLRLFPGESHSLNIDFLMTPLKFVLGRPGPLLNPGTSQYSACCGIRWWSIRVRWPSQRSLLSLIMFSMLCCPVLTLTSSFVILSFQKTPTPCLKKRPNFGLL